MAIARDAVTGVTGMGAPAASYTFAHTCTGSNLMLTVGIFVSINPASDVVSGVTYNGVAMTRSPNGYAAAPANNSTWLYYLANPSTGANNVVITYSGTQNGSAGAISYTGCASTIDSGNSNTAGPSASSCTVSTTTVADNAWLVGVARADGGSRTFSAGMTAQGTEGFQSQMADSNGAKTPAGSYSMTYNATVSSFGLCLLSIAPFVAASSVKQLSALGCG
jgi:hypothetical protein